MTNAVRKLTSLEHEALLTGLNLSDAHPRMALTGSQRALVDALPAMFAEAAGRPFEDIENEAHSAFLRGMGQHSAPIGTGRILSCYSSSVAMDIVARVLAERTSRVALIHPTFDNIPDLLLGRGLSLLPLPEGEVAAGAGDLPADVGAVFVTTPNNPTGWILAQDSLRALAGLCRDSGRILALDTCFRSQDVRAQYDTYAVLADSGAEWIVIEDTGKLWPMLELKAGFLCFAERCSARLLDAFDDVLLTMSPLVLLLVRKLAEDAAAGGYARFRHLIEGNRELLGHATRPGGLCLTDPDSQISVARLTVPGSWGSAADLYRALLRHGVHTLPCDAFYWADPPAGGQELRIALARDQADVARAVKVLQEITASHETRPLRHGGER